MTIIDQIKKSHSRVFRKAYIKRRLSTTGLFETDWLEITNDVKKYGKIRREIDDTRPSRFRFSPMKLVMANDNGLYNTEDSPSSLWNGYASIQRTLVKIEAGFIDSTLAADGTRTNTVFPSTTTVFIGIISGDFNVDNTNEVAINVAPLTKVFQDYPARQLAFSQLSGTANTFLTNIRDQTDGAGAFIFRPFFGDTTTNFDFTSTGTNYSWATSATQEFVEKTVWEAIEIFAEAEQYVPYITRDGKFRFVPGNPLTSTASFEFFGLGTNDRTYGHTIKKIAKYGKKVSAYFSYIQVKYNDASTITSYEVAQTQFSVDGQNNPWNFGHRKYDIDNTLIPNSATAQNVATQVLTELGTLRDEIEMTTTFIPHLEILDRIEVSYSTRSVDPRALWDRVNWDEFNWDASVGDALNLSAKEFKILSIEMDLDKFECKFIGRST